MTVSEITLSSSPVTVASRKRQNSQSAELHSSSSYEERRGVWFPFNLYIHIYQRNKIIVFVSMRLGIRTAPLFNEYNDAVISVPDSRG